MLGADALAHIPIDSLTDDQLLQLKASKVVIIPTITVIQSYLTGHSAVYMSDSLLWKTADPRYLRHIIKGRPSEIFLLENSSIKKYRIKYLENMQNCIKYKIPILAGTDAGNYADFYGYSIHNELLEYVHAGMTNSEALCSATKNIQKIFPALEIGEIKPGYYADMIVLNKNHIIDIQNTKKIDIVFHHGKYVWRF